MGDAHDRSNAKAQEPPVIDSHDDSPSRADQLATA
jgi:hypothetical protein